MRQLSKDELAALKGKKNVRIRPKNTKPAPPEPKIEPKIVLPDNSEQISKQMGHTVDMIREMNQAQADQINSILTRISENKIRRMNVHRTDEGLIDYVEFV